MLLLLYKKILFLKNSFYLLLIILAENDTSVVQKDFSMPVMEFVLTKYLVYSSRFSFQQAVALLLSPPPSISRLCPKVALYYFLRVSRKQKKTNIDNKKDNKQSWKRRLETPFNHSFVQRKKKKEKKSDYVVSI